MQYIKYFIQHIFAVNPGSGFKYYIPLLILAVILIIGSIIFASIYKKRKKYNFAFKRLFKKVSGRFLILGIILLILIAVRYENIPYFSMRLWLFIFFVVLIYFIYKYIWICKTDYPREKGNVETKQRQSVKSAVENKYLPHKKKR